MATSVHTDVNVSAGFAHAHPIHRHISLIDQLSMPSLVLGAEAIRIRYIISCRIFGASV